MPDKLTARQYIQVRCLLISSHAITFAFSFSMLVVTLMQRHLYLKSARIEANADKDVLTTNWFMVTSGAVGLVQPSLFFCIHVAYPLVRQRQWAVQEDRLQRSAEMEQQQQQQPPPHACASHAESRGDQRALVDFVRTSALTAHDSHMHPPLSRIHIEAEGTPLGKAGATTEAATAAAAVTPASDSSLPVLGLELPQVGLRLSLKASLSSPPLAPLLPPPPQGAHSGSPPPQKLPMTLRGNGVTATYSATAQHCSLQSTMEAEADLSKTALPLSLSPSVNTQAPVEAVMEPMAIVVPPVRHLPGNCPLFCDCSAPSRAETDGVVLPRDRRDGATAAGCAGGGKRIRVVSDPAPPLFSDVTRAIVKAPGDVTTSELGGEAIRRSSRRLPNAVTHGALAMPGDVDGSTPAAAMAAPQSGTACQLNVSLAKGATSPLTARARFSVRALTPPLSSVGPSDTGDPTSIQQACPDIFSATPSTRSAVQAPTVGPTAAVPRAALVRDRYIAVLSSEEVQPPKGPTEEASQHGKCHPGFSGDNPQRSFASVFLRTLPWFIPTPVAAKVPSPQSHPARRTAASQLSTSVRPLPPALLHMYFKYDTTFHLLLAAYYIFAAVGILLMYFFGMLCVVRRGLHGLTSVLLMVGVQGNVLMNQNMKLSVKAAFSKTAMYTNTEAVHKVSHSLSTASQYERLKRFNTLQPTIYSPDVRYTRIFLILLALSVVAGLVSLCVVVFNCGTGVLVSVGYASLSQREQAAREAQAMLEASVFCSYPESAPELHSLHPPVRASSPLFPSTDTEAPLPAAPMAVAPSRERLMHTFEGLHAPSAALLPPLWVVMAEMSSSGGGLVAPPVSMTR
ncbi:hypothetical protein LPMP_332130 [Leishmania panamensis]|uniref:hypothetical protein n=1 Tax=Leishmania panamensis TaxID=5679 RepID=UPI0004F6E3E1|nr:hypothetical protein LPMP_332130 [Leishmania panamensis]AIO01504.1 hypothetical protein LPMP_332130 [Leishmania panamensis]